MALLRVPQSRSLRLGLSFYAATHGRWPAEAGGPQSFCLLGAREEGHYGGWRRSLLDSRQEISLRAELVILRSRVPSCCPVLSVSVVCKGWGFRFNSITAQTGAIRHER